MTVVTGQVVRGYELHELLGIGGFGAVYRAYQPMVKRDVAVKIILPQYANQPDFIRSFEIEAQLIARLEHLHIVPLYDYWREPNGAYLVMRWLRGGSVRSKLQHGPLDLDSIALMLEHTAGALTVAHRRGIVHRDIKPDNILLDDEGNYYLSDFGIAQDIEKTPALDENEEPPEIFAGSLTYTSPEQIRGEIATPLTDIYSLGILLYEVLTGEHPFPDAAPAALVFKHLSEPVPSVRERFPEYSQDIDIVIRRATSKTPEDRYPDPVTMAAAFRRAIRSSKRRIAIPDGTIHPSPMMDTTPTSFDRLMPEVETPYKGLRPFEEADAAEFFGREALTEQLLARLNEGSTSVVGRFLAVVGASGSGKSSIVKAGLIPALRGGALPNSKNWFIAEMVPGAHPFEELERALLSVAVSPSEGLSDLLHSEGGLTEALRAVMPEGDENVLLLYIDQFEEIFTQVEQEETRARFLKNLWAAVTAPDSNFRLIITLRADFYDRPLAYHGFGDLIRKRTEVVLPMTLEELQRAIVDPALHVGVDLEPGLVLAIMADVSEQPGALPLLQYALTELFERREGRLLRLDAYHSIGGVLGALARRAEELYQGLDIAGQQVARQLFLRLVTPGEGSDATRRRVLRTELMSLNADESLVASVIDTFGKYRLLTFDRDPVTRAPTIEIAHEALIRQWARVHDWLEESREDLSRQRRLAAAANEWINAGQDSSFLARGSRLDQFEAWAKDTELALNQTELAFLHASIAAREARLAEETAQREREAMLERRSRNRLRVLALVLLIATVGALGLSAIAITQSEAAQRSAITAAHAQELAYIEAANAQTQAAIAQTNALEARSLALAASSQLALKDGNSDMAVLLALEANRVVNPMQAQLALAEVAYSPGTERQLRGHLAPVTDVAISPDQKLVISVSRDGYGYVWDVASGEIVHRLSGHQDRVTSIVFSPDGEIVLTGSWDGTARLWDVATGDEIGRIQHTSGVLAVAFSPGGRTMATATDGGSVFLWDVASRQRRRRLDGHEGAVTAIAFSPDSRFIASGSMDKTITVWNLNTGREVIRLAGHTDRITSLAFHPNGRLLASGSSDNTVRVWDIETGADVARFSSHTDSVTDVAFDPQGRMLLSVSWDGSMYHWDLETGQAVHHFLGHTGAVTSVAIAGDGHHAVSGSDDTTVRIWEIDSSSDRQRYRFYIDEVTTVEVSPDGRYAAAAGENTSFVLWDIATGSQIRRFVGHTGSVLSLAFNPEGNRIISSSSDGNVIAWNVSTGEQIRRYPGHTDVVSSLDFSSDGRYFVTASWDQTLILWDASIGNAIRRFSGGHDDRILTVQFSTDNRLILSGSNDGKLIAWDVDTGSIIWESTELNVAILQIAVSPDGQTFMTASADGVARLWDLETGALIREYVGHRSSVLTVAIMPDGTTALTGSRDRSLILWDIASGAQIYRFEGHTDAVTSVTFLQNGATALSGSRDKTIRLWRTHSLATLVEWTSANRFIPTIDCSAQTLYRIEALCGTAQPEAVAQS